jgi:hypothetical protein
MNAVLRKSSVLALLFSGAFLAVNFTLTWLFQVNAHSWIYSTFQIGTAGGMVLLLLTKKIEVY